jgi:hypothetical protein
MMPAFLLAAALQASAWQSSGATRVRKSPRAEQSAANGSTRCAGGLPYLCDLGVKRLDFGPLC